VAECDRAAVRVDARVVVGDAELAQHGQFLAAQGKRVLIGAADIEFDRDILGGFRAIPYVRRLGYLKAFATNCIFQVVNSTLRAAILPLLQTCDL
jgi:hypothetical protein